ncbi:MAG: gamma-glutamyl-gamma-aminobutyrate hydrolase family protein, partial [Terriglobia bacterium]
LRVWRSQGDGSLGAGLLDRRSARIAVKRAILTVGDLAKAGPYRDALLAAGVDPIVVTAAQGLESLHGMGLVLAGGTDINPALYTADPDPRSQTPDTVRDELELRLLREALAADLPVFAICRGFQLFNVTHTGGSLSQHIEEHKLKQKRMHEVEIYEGSCLARILGAGMHAVNSRHHQAVADTGWGLVVSAKSPSGVIEGLERPDLRFAIAVQWHPEDMVRDHPLQRKLFEEFQKHL